jgi:hypothetical protein
MTQRLCLESCSSSYHVFRKEFRMYYASIEYVYIYIVEMLTLFLHTCNAVGYDWKGKYMCDVSDYDLGHIFVSNACLYGRQDL